MGFGSPGMNRCSPAGSSTDGSTPNGKIRYAYPLVVTPYTATWPACSRCNIMGPRGVVTARVIASSEPCSGTTRS
jgi:hypothetical protein